jgi:hypothetical protein
VNCFFLVYLTLIPQSHADSACLEPQKEIAGWQQGQNSLFAGLPSSIQFEDLDLIACLSWQVEPQTQPTRAGVMQVLLFNMASGRPFDLQSPSDFRVILWMEMQGGHSHGSAPTQITRLMANGQPVAGGYLVSNMQFYMRGKWEVRFSLTRQGKVSTVKIHLEIP